MQFFIVLGFENLPADFAREVALFVPLLMHQEPPAVHKPEPAGFAHVVAEVLVHVLVESVEVGEDDVTERALELVLGQLEWQHQIFDVEVIFLFVDIGHVGFEIVEVVRLVAAEPAVYSGEVQLEHVFVVRYFEFPWMVELRGVVPELLRVGEVLTAVEAQQVVVAAFEWTRVGKLNDCEYVRLSYIRGVPLPHPLLKFRHWDFYAKRLRLRFKIYIFLSYSEMESLWWLHANTYSATLKMFLLMVLGYLNIYKKKITLIHFFVHIANI